MKILKRSVIIANYFLFEGSLIQNLKKHKRLKNTLQFFIAGKLISSNTEFLYLRKYISTALSIGKNADNLNYHYAFLKRKFGPDVLKDLFVNGVVCYREESYRIILSGSKEREREGSLSLYFMDDDTTISQLSFTICDGKTLNVVDEPISVISRIQQINAYLENIKNAKKHFNDIMPTLILFTVLEAICVALNIRKVLGINGVDQLSWETQYEQSYKVNYDEFWMHNGGTKTQFGYLMDCPFPQKDLAEIKQTHRNRARKKREKLDLIYSYAYAQISPSL